MEAPLMRDAATFGGPMWIYAAPTLPLGCVKIEAATSLVVAITAFATGVVAGCGTPHRDLRSYTRCETRRALLPVGFAPNCLVPFATTRGQVGAPASA